MTGQLAIDVNMQFLESMPPSVFIDASASFISFYIERTIDIFVCVLITTCQQLKSGVHLNAVSSINLIIA